MAEFRAFFFDERDRLAARQELSGCLTHAQAMTVAKRLPHAHSMELWDGQRMIARFPAPVRRPEMPWRL